MGELVDEVDGVFVYNALSWGRLNEEFQVIPVSREILFYPDHANAVVKGGSTFVFDCLRITRIYSDCL